MRERSPHRPPGLHSCPYRSEITPYEYSNGSQRVTTNQESGGLEAEDAKLAGLEDRESKTTPPAADPESSDGNISELLDALDLVSFAERHRNSLAFPEVLMVMIRHIEREYAAIQRTPACPRPIEWVQEGQVVAVRDKDELSRTWLPTFYHQSVKYSSFTRKLYRWGFRQVSVPGETQRSESVAFFHHDLFRRDDVALVSQMQSSPPQPAGQKDNPGKPSPETSRKRKRPSRNVDFAELLTTFNREHAAIIQAQPVPVSADLGSFVSALSAVDQVLQQQQQHHHHHQQQHVSQGAASLQPFAIASAPIAHAGGGHQAMLLNAIAQLLSLQAPLQTWYRQGSSQQVSDVANIPLQTLERLAAEQQAVPPLGVHQGPPSADSSVSQCFARTSTAHPFSIAAAQSVVSSQQDQQQAQQGAFVDQLIRLVTHGQQAQALGGLGSTQHQQMGANLPGGEAQTGQVGSDASSYPAGSQHHRLLAVVSFILAQQGQLGL